MTYNFRYINSLLIHTHFIVYSMLLFFCLAIFLDFAKLAAAEETKDPDAPGTLTILYRAFFS